MQELQTLIVFSICFVLITETHGLPKETRQNGKIAVAIRKGASPQRHRAPRDIRVLRVKDPLDCLSQVICGMNASPPQKPSVRTSTSNDFAFLLKSAIAKMRSQTTTTTTTVAPATTKRTTPKAPLNDDDDDDEYDDDTIENDMDFNEAHEVEDYPDSHPGPPPIPIDRRRLRRSSIFRIGRREKNSKSRRQDNNKHSRTKGNKVKNNNRRPMPMVLQLTVNKNIKPVVLSPLDRLRMETNLRAKLLSDAQCINGLNDHTCPFNYQQMLSLISSSLERERTVSYTTSKVLPMVGYLIKSRNYTATLSATFAAIERINNYTLEADKEGKTIDFSHILDEVMNRVTGDNGLRIVDTSNDHASAEVWEDDEFDHVLQNPYVRQRPQSDNYKLNKKKQEKKQKQKQKVSQLADNDDQSTTSEEDTSEEGLIFDRPRPPPQDTPGGPDLDSSTEEDREDEHSKVFGDGEKNKFALSEKEKLIPPPVFGHLQKSADDE